MEQNAVIRPLEISKIISTSEGITDGSGGVIRFAGFFDIMAKNLELVVPNWLLLFAYKKFGKARLATEEESEGRFPLYQEDGHWPVQYVLKEQDEGLSAKALSYALLKTGIIPNSKALGTVQSRVTNFYYNAKTNTIHLAQWRLEPDEVGLFLCEALGKKLALAYFDEEESFSRFLTRLIAHALPLKHIHTKGEDEAIAYFWEKEVKGKNTKDFLDLLERIRQATQPVISKLRGCSRAQT